MTKEMRPSHRIDVLSSALAYYGIKTKEKLGIVRVGVRQGHRHYFFCLSFFACSFSTTRAMGQGT